MIRGNWRTAGALATILVGILAASASAEAPQWALKQNWYPKAPPLPQAQGEVVRVATPAELVEACKAAKDDQTILIADGEYKMSSGLQIRDVNRVTLRGASNDPRKVVLDFAGAGKASAVAFWHTVGSTIAHVTVANRPQNGLKLDSNTGTSHITIYNVIIHNVWQRPIKGVRVPDKDGKPQWIEGCKVQYCLIYNDRPKRKGDDQGADDNNFTEGFNYIAGMDIMGAAGWVISDNVFVNIHGGTGAGRGAIFMWNGCRDVTIERNIIIDCDAGICLGNASARVERRHCEGFLVRNNFVTRCPEKNILACHTRNCRIVNNTVYDPDSRLGRQMRIIFANDGLVVADNIFVGKKILQEDVEGPITVENNLVSQDVAGYFVDAAHGNLHLTDKATKAIDKATVRKDVPTDIDNQPRGEKPDLGADEFVPAE